MLQNATGQKITISPFTNIVFGTEYGYGKILFQGQEYIFEEVTIGTGEEFTIIGQGVVLEEQITITYYEEQTGLTTTVSSTIGTDAPDNVEISNDGIDNDGDGLTDCEEAGIEECRYTIKYFDIYEAMKNEIIEFPTNHLFDKSPIEQETFVFFIKEGIEQPNYTVTVCSNFFLLTCIMPTNSLEPKTGWNYYTPNEIPITEIGHKSLLTILDGNALVISEEPGFEPKMIIEMG